MHVEAGLNDLVEQLYQMHYNLSQAMAYPKQFSDYLQACIIYI